MEDDAVIVPKPGKEKETIRLLLELADNRRHVRTNTDGPGLVLIVPAYLAQKYNQSGETEITGVKRRGRPPGRRSTPAQVQPEADTEAQAQAEAETPESED